jgi:hypothetical protein
VAEVLLEKFQASDDRVVSAYLDSFPNPVEAVKAAAKALSQSYWGAKDIVACKRIARVATEWGLNRARTSGNAECTNEILSTIKEMAYNLGSFLWPGWDEAGIVLTGEDAAIGEAAAARNLKLALDLGRGPLPLAHAHWLLGAYRLAAEDGAAARDAFVRAAAFAGEANDCSHRLLNLAYAALADGLRENSEIHSEEVYRDALDALAGVEHGADFVQQVRVAERVFARKGIRV